MARIELESVVREVEGHRILDAVSFTVEDGEFVSVIGQSGAGKTSVVRAIAGFDEISSGRILFDGEDMAGVPTRNRDLGFVFQENALFPNRRVRENVAFPLRIRAIAEPEIRKRVQAESRAHNIQHILDRWPANLSGGEAQLSQIARALVRVPDVFLLDEPLSNLDPPTQHHLRAEIVTLQRGYGVTTVYATNHPREIMQMPDRVVALDEGRIAQIGAPLDVYNDPASRAIGDLTGPMDTMQVTVEGAPEGYFLVAGEVRMRAWAPALETFVGRSLTLGTRSRFVRVDTAGGITVTAGRTTYEGGQRTQRLLTSTGELSIIDGDLREGRRLTVSLDRWHLFDASGANVLTVG